PQQYQTNRRRTPTHSTSCTPLIASSPARRPPTSTLFPYTTLFRSLLVQSAGGISRSLVERLLIDWGAEFFPNFAFRLQSPHLLFAGPRSRIELRIIHHHGDFHVVSIEAAPAFCEMHLIAVDVAKMIDPGPVVNPDGFNDECVA